MNNKEINFIEAKMLAESSAKKLITVWGDLEDPSPPYLSNYYMEDKGCWIFFRHERIIIPPEKGPATSAFAVSKKGEIRLIADYRDSPERAKEYLKTMSDHFIKHGW